MKTIKQGWVCVFATALTACGGGGNDKPNDVPVTTQGTQDTSGNQATPATLSADQQAFETLNTTGGQFDLGWGFPFEDTSRTGTVNFIGESVYSLMTQSPAIGPQTQTRSNALLLPGMDQQGTVSTAPRRYLINAKVWFDIPQPQNPTQPKPSRTVSYSADGVDVAYLGQDSQSHTQTVLSQHITHVNVLPLSGVMQKSPGALLAALPIQNWVGFGIFHDTANWAQGAAYVMTQAKLVNDTVYVQDCNNQMTSTVTTGAEPKACAVGTTLEHIFPIVLRNGNKPFENEVASDGIVHDNVQGVRMWIAKQPLPLAQTGSTMYRVYFEMNGNVYQGLQQKDGTPLLERQADGSVQAYHISLNSQAVSSVAAGLISTATGTGSGTEKANLAALPSIDLYGIGGHGINGALTPADLRQHYNIPDSLTGAGQTIAIVDAPGAGDVQNDLAIFSQAYGLPDCSQSNGCFKRIDLSSGGTPATGAAYQGWGNETALDVEMIHAIAPNANIILVTAASSTGQGLIDAINVAARQSGVTAVSMSFGVGADVTSKLVQDGKFASSEAVNGTIFFASSGDNAYFPAGSAPYPAESPYVTAVGGTRINSVLASVDDEAWSYSGGGTSTYADAPTDWAVGGNPGCTVSNTGKRAFPDVAALADELHSSFAIYHRGRWALGGGTSAAAPLWAGLSALLSQHLGMQGLSLAQMVKNAPEGFNSLLYQIGRSKPVAAGTGFRNILTGSNNMGAGGCQAQAGYNGLTGLGTPDVALLAANFKSLATSPSP